MHYAVYKLERCPNCDDDGNLMQSEVVYTDGLCAAFPIPEDAIAYAKAKGPEYFVINLNNGKTLHMGSVVIKLEDFEDGR